MIPAVETLAVVELTPQVKYRALLDTITAHVTECNGYTIVCWDAPYVGVELKYPGGAVPLAIDPTKPLPYLVALAGKAIQVWRAIMAFDVAKCG